jgi:uncharacterized protein YecE (DUF72 family)
MGRILVGISSWADRGLVESGYYPTAVKTPAERLRYYSAEFAVAEIDATYHRFATRKLLTLWLENTPPGFTFDIKTFSLFTQHPTPFASLPRALREQFPSLGEHKGNLYPHHLPSEALEDLWEGFVRTAEAIKTSGKLGAVLFQFPPWFHPGRESFDYLAECCRRLPDLPLAVEFRAASWFGAEHLEETLVFLREHGITVVCVDEPQGFSSSLPPFAGATAPLGLLRFHGRNRENWESREAGPDERYNYLYGEEELKEWLPKVRYMAGETDELHVIFKNKHADFPVRNARRFREMLEGVSSAPVGKDQGEGEPPSS